MTTPTALPAPGLRGAQAAGGPRTLPSTSGDAFAATLSRTESAQRRPAQRPEAQDRRLEAVTARRTDTSTSRSTTLTQRERHGADLGAPRPRGTAGPAQGGARPTSGATAPGTAGAGTPSLDARATAGAATAGLLAPGPADGTTGGTAVPAPVVPDAAALLALQLAGAEDLAEQGGLPAAEQPAAEASDETAHGARPGVPAAAGSVPTAGAAGTVPAAGAAAPGLQPSTSPGDETAGADGAPAAVAPSGAAGGTAASVAAATGAAATTATTSASPAATPTAAAGPPAPQVAEPTVQGGTGASADQAQDGAGSARADGAPASAAAQTTPSSSTSSFAQTLAGLTPTQAPERVLAVPQPATAAAAGASLAEQVRGPVMALRHAAPGEHTLTLQVTPDSLGPVQVKAHIGAGGVRIELLGATDAGRDGLRALLTDLRRDLAGTGMNASLSLAGDGDRGQGSLAGEWGTGQQGGRGETSRPGLRTAPGAPQPGPPGETARPTAPTTGAAGVDVLT